MSAKHVALLLLSAGIAADCGRPRLAAWDACTQADTAIVSVGTPPAWSIARGGDTVLTLRDHWGYPPLVTHRARSGLMQVRVPSTIGDGQVVTLAPGEGFYTENDGGAVFESTALAGKIEFVVVTADRARTRLDIRATHPTIDVEGATTGGYINATSAIMSGNTTNMTPGATSSEAGVIYRR